jgi:orotate phosphoribosyltransferase
LTPKPDRPSPTASITKVVKDHGEAGGIVGASLKWKNIVVYDVITAGTAIRETTELVAKKGGKEVGLAVALDRVEKMPGPREKEEGLDDGEPSMSAMRQIKQEFGVQRTSIIGLDDRIAASRGKGYEGDIERLENYRRKHMASD